jgi:hypothetical protein
MKTNDKFSHVEEYEHILEKESPYYNQNNKVDLDDIKNYQHTPPSRKKSREYSQLKNLQTPATRKSLRTGATQVQRGISDGSRSGSPSLYEGSSSVVNSVAFRQTNVNLQVLITQ